MALKETSYSIDDILNHIKIFSEYLNEYFPNKINNTPFADYISILNEIKDGDIKNFGYLPIIQKFVFLSELIKSKDGILYNQDGLKLKLKKLIKRNSKLLLHQDSEQEYNRELFEFSMAARFSKIISNDKTVRKINISDICDVIIDDEIGVECKYVTSKNKIKERLLDGISQINKRIINNSLKYGLVALDLSNILNNIDGINGLMDIKKKFNNKEEMLKTISKQYQKMITHLMREEIKRYIIETWNGNNDINIKPDAILFQSYNYTFIELDEEMIPVFYRTLDFCINPNISKGKSDYVKSIIEKLATGM